MPIPPQLLEKIFEFVIKTSGFSFRGNQLLRKIDLSKIGGYVIKIYRRGILGADGAISQKVTIFKNGKKEEIWHVVVKFGKIIHKHLLK